MFPGGGELFSLCPQTVLAKTRQDARMYNEGMFFSRHARKRWPCQYLWNFETMEVDSLFTILLIRESVVDIFLCTF